MNSNPEAIKLLEQNPSRINFELLCFNKNGLELLFKYVNIDKIHWAYLSQNENAIDFLEKNKNKLNYYSLSFNKAIFEYDYNQMSINNREIYEELIEEVMKPSRVFKNPDYDYIEELFGD